MYWNVVFVFRVHEVGFCMSAMSGTHILLPSYFGINYTTSISNLIDMPSIYCSIDLVKNYDTLI